MASTLGKIRRSFAAAALLAALLVLAAAWFVLQNAWDVLPQLIYRNTGAYAATRVRDFLNAGRDLPGALSAVTAEFERDLPGSFVSALSGGRAFYPDNMICSPAGPNVNTALFEMFRGPLQPLYPLPYIPVCREQESLLGGGIVTNSNDPALVTLTTFGSELSGERNFAQYLRTFFVGAILPLFFFALWIVLWERFFRRLLAKSTLRAAEKAKNFAAGDLHSRFEAGDFPEHQQLAETFNSLAEGVSRRIRRLKDDEAKRRGILAELAHDLRTPMTAIEGCISLLEEPSTPVEKRTHYLHLIDMGTAAQEDIATRLGELANLDSVVESIEFTEVDVPQLLQAVLRLSEPMARRKSISVTSSPREDSRFVRGNAELLKRAILNLVDNAVRHTAEGGSISISSGSEPEGKFYFEVEDSGNEAGFNLVNDISSAKHPARIGLGLAIVDRIAGLHRGFVEFLRREPAGTTVRLHLHSALGIPQNSDAEKERTETKQNERPPSDRRVAEVIFLTTCCLMALTQFVGVRGALLVLPMAGLLLAFLPRLLFRRSSPFLDIGAAAAFLSLALLENAFGPMQVGCGMFTVSAVYHLSRSFPEPLSAVPVAAGALLIVSLFSLMPGPQLLTMGLSIGLWSVLISWSSQWTLPMRRAGNWFGAVSLVGAGLFVFLIAGSLYRTVLVSLHETATRNIGKPVQNLVSDLATLTSNSEWRNARILQSSFVNPLYDFGFFDSSGKLLLQTGWDRPKELETNGGVPPAVGLTRESFRHSQMASPICAGESCPVLRARIPSLEAEAIAIREISALLIPFTVFGIVALVLIFTALSFYWDYLFRYDFEPLQTGLRRYLSGSYDRPIAIPAENDLAPLGHSLDSLAERIPALENAIADERFRLRTFLVRASSTLSAGARAIRDSMAEFRHSPVSENFLNLDLASASQRKIIQNLFLMSYPGERIETKHRETFFIGEAVSDELERLMELSGASVHADIMKDDPPIFISSAVFIQSVRLLLQAAFERSAAQSPISVAVREVRDGIEVVVNDGGTPLSPGTITFLLRPFEHESPEAPDEILPPALQGYSLAAIAQLLSESGAKLSLSGGPNGGLEYTLFFPREERCVMEER